MNTKELVETLDILTEDIQDLTKEQIREIINSITFEDTELEEDEELKILTFNTMYNEYKCYGLTYDDKFVILAKDYYNYLQDVGNEVGQSLPDGIDDFFHSDELYNYLINNGNKDIINSYIENCVKFINKNTDTDYYTYKQVDSGMYNGIEYVLIEEI